MNMLLLNILLSLAWTGLTGQFTPTNLIVGFILGFAVLWIVQHHREGERSSYFSKLYAIFSFSTFFGYEVVKANLRVAYDILTPRQHMTPGIIAVPLDAETDMEITLLANLITLTPGTLSLDLSTDRRVLYIHAMYMHDADAFRKEIKEELERRLLEVLR